MIKTILLIIITILCKRAHRPPCLPTSSDTPQYHLWASSSSQYAVPTSSSTSCSQFLGMCIVLVIPIPYLHLTSYFPGHIHAVYVEYVYYKRRDEIRAGIYDGNLAPGVYSTKVQQGGQKNVVVQPAPVAGGVPPAQQGYGTATV